MSGGHWNYQDVKMQEAAASVNWAITVLAEVEHQLDLGISGDACYECAKLRVIQGLQAYFENVGLHEYDREPLAILRGEAESHLCGVHWAEGFAADGARLAERRGASEARQGVFRYRCGKCGEVKDVLREVEKADLPVPCWKGSCWDEYHGEPAPMTLVGAVG